MTARIVSPSSVVVTPDHGIIGNYSSGTPVVTISPSRYAIEIRDKNFQLKRRIESHVTALSWEWNRIGGCGRATIKVDGNYKGFQVNPDDDVRIYLPKAGSGALLWYRGYVEAVSPIIQTGNSGSITIECTGYFGWLDRIIVHDSGASKVYTNQEVSAVVQNIVDNFIVGNSGITRGTIQSGNFSPDSISFKTTAKEAIRTLFDLLGTVEYGINENLQFFWYNQDPILKHVFYLGDKVVKITDRVDFKNIVNKIYFEGGEASPGVVFQATGQSQSSINRYGKHEEIISNGSIYTSNVASQFITSILRQRGIPARQLSISLKNTTKRFETSLPIGAASIVDSENNQTGAVYGTTAAGGSNKYYGSVLNGGSGQLYGGVAKHQVDRVQYQMSPEDGRVHAEVQFGTSIGYSRASAALRKLELEQNALRLRSL